MRHVPMIDTIRINNRHDAYQTKEITPDTYQLSDTYVLTKDLTSTNNRRDTYQLRDATQRHIPTDRYDTY
jgi:hypothetical protein